MRKPRDFDSALRALTDKTKALKENKRRQLGELIMATGADALDMAMLAGALLAMVQTADTAQKILWAGRRERFRSPLRSTRIDGASYAEIVITDRDALEETADPDD